MIRFLTACAVIETVAWLISRDHWSVTNWALDRWAKPGESR